MNKQDLLNAVRNKFTSLLSVEKIERIENVTWYLAHYFDVDGGQATKGNFGFYVVDEDGPKEAAYWDRREPKATPSTPVPTFRQKLQEHLTTLIGAGTIEGGTIQAVDDVNKTATVSVWLESDGNIIEKQFFIDKDSKNTWRRREIV